MKKLYKLPTLEVINIEKEDIVLYTSSNLLGYTEIDFDGTGNGWDKE